MVWVLAVILGVLPLMVMAESLPNAVSAQVERNPDKYLDDLAVIIAAYGTDGAIDGHALHNVVAVARADARSMALHRLQGADLNGDGAISGAELKVRAEGEAATARGRLILYFGKADLDGDDQVTAAELQAYANAVAQKSFSEDKAAAVYAILGFDSNGDGRVTLAEAKAAIDLVASTGSAKEIQNKLKIQGDDHQSDQNGQGNQPARGGQGPHLLPVGSEHDKGHDGKAQL